MSGDLWADPDGLLVLAARLEALRDEVCPAGLPVGCAPAGADTASARAATRLSASAAGVADGLWALWSSLGFAADRLRATAANYASQEAASAARLAGAGGGGPAAVWSPAPPPPRPPVVPQVHAGVPSASAAQLSALIRSGAGAQSPAEFGGRWSVHATALGAASDGLAAVRAGLPGVWSGPAAEDAGADLAAIHGAVEAHHGPAVAVARKAVGDAEAHTDAISGMPTPEDFTRLQADIDAATAANALYPGVYTAAVQAAMQRMTEAITQMGVMFTNYEEVLDSGTIPQPPPVPAGGGRASAVRAGGDAVSAAAARAAGGLPAAAGGPLGAGGDAAEAPDAAMGGSGAELLTGLLTGVMGGVSAAAGALGAGLTQTVQLATQTAGSLAKGLGGDSALGPEVPMPELPDLPGLGAGGGEVGGGEVGGLGGGELGGLGGGEGGGMGAGLGGGMIPAAATVVGSAPTAPAPTPAGAGLAVSAGRTAGESAAGGIGGPPMMPMTGAGGAGAGAAAGAVASTRQMRTPEKPNTTRVIGATDNDRVVAKRERRTERLAAAKAAAEAETSSE